MTKSKAKKNVKAVVVAKPGVLTTIQEKVGNIYAVGEAHKKKLFLSCTLASLAYYWKFYWSCPKPDCEEDSSCDSSSDFTTCDEEVECDDSTSQDCSSESDSTSSSSECESSSQSSSSSSQVNENIIIICNEVDDVQKQNQGQDQGQDQAQAQTQQQKNKTVILNSISELQKHLGRKL